MIVYDLNNHNYHNNLRSSPNAELVAKNEGSIQGTSEKELMANTLF